MTTTPDSRIRADFGVAEAVELDPNLRPPDYSGVRQWVSRAEAVDMYPPAEPIDTSTTAGKVRVMEHVASGGQMQMMTRGRGGTDDDDGWSDSWTPPSNYNFNWERYDYRIAPPPAPRSALQAARECRSRMTTVDVTSPAGRLCSLLTDIDYSPIVEVLERRISWDAADLSALPKGRYRLLRDDA